MRKHITTVVMPPLPTLLLVVAISSLGYCQNSKPDVGIEERKQLCAHFAGGLAEIPEQGDWQKMGLCTTELTMKWLEVAARNCISCQTGRDVCKKPPILIFHQYLDKLHPTLWRANLLSVQSVLVRTYVVRQTDTHIHL